MTAPQPPAAGASRSPAPEGQEAEHVSSREAAERGGSWVSFAVHERTLAALAGARTDASALREQGEAIAQRVAYEYARIRHERSLCNPMLRCSSCPRWEELSEEARLAMAQDFDGEAVMSAVRAALDAARPGAPEGGSDGD